MKNCLMRIRVLLLHFDWDPDTWNRKKNFFIDAENTTNINFKNFRYIVRILKMKWILEMMGFHMNPENDVDP